MTASSPNSSKMPHRARVGPRPLALHLMAAATSYTSSNAALPLLKNGLMQWSPALADAANPLQKNLESVSPDALAVAVEAVARQRLGAFLDGVERYRNHPYRRRVETPPPVWTSGTTRLFDYGVGNGGLPVLLVPSLVNRAYILDLYEDRSFARWMADQGLWPFLLDWDTPGDAERQFGLTDYILRLELALAAVADLTAARPAVLGYCMGGLLALALAQRDPAAIAGLVLLATPWDFQADRPAQAAGVAGIGAAAEGIMTALGELPVDILQMLFAGLDPVLAERKFSAFAALDPDSDKAREFVVLEDWVNDGVPLAAPVARECLGGWYGENAPAAGAWRVDDTVVDPAAVTCPVLAVIPAEDRIVPAASALALSEALPDVRTMRVDAGHIGMMVSHDIDRQLWPEISDWLARLS